MCKDKKSAFEKAKDYIIKAGFSHIKIEMEADLGREEDDYECDECYGEGRVDCPECDGTGVVMATRPNGTEVEVECECCDGEGRIDCEYCDGTGERSSGDNNWTCDACDEWIRDYVSEDARKALTYSKFYYDGSVDSEMTLTLPVANAEYLVEYLQAFKALGDEIGNGVETGGAGLHVCIIPKESNGYYPAERGTLPEINYDNFSRQVSKLLPAMFLLAGPDSISRGLGYRVPQVSSVQKYSAIYSDYRSSLEYRLFETCYDTPETIKDYVEVIANTLKFYVDPTLTVEDYNMTFNMTDNNRDVARFYRTPESIKLLRSQLKYVKPSGKKVHELLKEREVPTITELKKQISSKKKELTDNWKENDKRTKVALKSELSPRQIYHANSLRREGNYTEEQIQRIVRNLNMHPEPLLEYVECRMSEFMGTDRNGYTLTI